MSIYHFPRALYQTLRRDLTVYPIVAVVGARQVGKSTLGRQIAEELGIPHRTLDDRDVLAQALEDPEGLLSDLGEGGFIDEAQRAPELFLALKGVVDREQRPGQYLISGSNQPKMTGAVGDSLLGRAAYRTLRPLTMSELRLEEEYAGWSFLFDKEDEAVISEIERRIEASGELDWKQAVETGGFPRSVAAPPDLRRRILDDYVQVFANRDIRELLAVESGDRFEQFLRLIATRVGQTLNVQGLANDLGIATSTVQRWIRALDRSFLLELLPSYSRNAGHRVIKAPKVFLTDVALALAAAREPEPTGFHLENLIATDLCVWRDQGPGRSLHYWRTRSGQEVDFVLAKDRRLLSVEVKTAKAVDAGDARHLSTFCDEHPNTDRGVLISSDPNVRLLKKGIIAAPWWGLV